MTVTYTAQVATSRGLGCFLKLLFRCGFIGFLWHCGNWLCGLKYRCNWLRWKGSIYKLLWPNLAVYSILYFGLSAYYRFIIDKNNREWFERLSIHCQTYGNLIPISFVLGFYVSIVIKRWWDQYVSIPWPDNLALFVSALVHGQDERGRLMRRTVLRYVNLSLVLTLRMVSPRVKKRFPTLDHLVDAGFMQSNEKAIFEQLEQKTNHPKYWMPLVWACGIVTRARREGRITNDFSMKTLIDELNMFRSGCGKVLSYDWISIPLVYTQVVTLAVYVYFMATLMGNQYLDVNKNYPKHQIDLVVPIFTFLEFFFYMGWLKVAESLVNPFGEDDDDFEVNWLIDRNLQISYVIVDEMHQEHPEMVKDQYWDEIFPVELPYTEASRQYYSEPPQGSTRDVEVPAHKADFIPFRQVANVPDPEDETEAHVSQRGSTHPLRIRCSSTSLHSSSLSVRREPRNSVLSMLTRIFHREDSAKDLEASQRSSCTSVRSRFGQLGNIPAATSVSAPICGDFQQEAMFKLSDISLSTPVQKTTSRSLLLLPAGDLDSPADCAMAEATVSLTTNTVVSGGTVAGVAVAAAAAAAAIATVRLKGRDEGTETADVHEENATGQTDDWSGLSSFTPCTSIIDSRKKETCTPVKWEPKDTEQLCHSESQVPRIVVSANTPIRQQFAPSSPTASHTTKAEIPTVSIQATPFTDTGLLSTLIESGITAKAQEVITILPPLPQAIEEKDIASPPPPIASLSDSENETASGLPYVPTPAIPIPTTAVPLAHPSAALDLLDVNIPPIPQRRTRDFPQLEPILEHSEVSGESPVDGQQIKKEPESSDPTSLV